MNTTRTIASAPLGLALALAILSACSAPQDNPQPAAHTATASATQAPTAPKAISALSEQVPFSDTQLLPQVITSFGATAHDGWLYVLGGYFGTPHEYSKAGQSGALYRVPVHGGNDWQELAGIEPLQSVILVSHGDSVIRIGGMRAINEPGTDPVLVSIDEVARYKPATGAWEAMPPLPEARSSHDAVMLGSKLYVVGGWALTEKSEWGGGHWYKHGLVMDLAAETPSWSRFAVPFTRRAIALTAVGEHLIVSGGMEDGEHSSRVDVYHIPTETWKRGPDFPDDGFGAAGTTIGQRVYISGMDGNTHSFVPGDSAWKFVDTQVFPRYFHRMVKTDDDKILAVGGIIKGVGRVRTIETIDLSAPTAKKPHIQRFTLRAPGPGKNRQAVFVRDNQIYVFGGNNSLEQHDFEPENFIDHGYKLSLGTLEWKPIKPYPKKRQTMQTVILGDGDTGLSVGGFGHDGKRARTHAESYIYDFDNDRWTERAATIPVPRSQFGLVRHGGYVWAFGGLDYDPDRPEKKKFQHATTVFKTKADDPSAPFANTKITMPRPRRAFGAAQLGNQYYMVGGMRAGFKLVAECDVYDFEKNAWSTIPAPKKTRISPELVALNGKLYLASGSVLVDDDMTPEAALEVYDPATQTWSVLLDKLPIDTTHMRMFAHRNRLLIYSAHSEKPTVELLFIDPS